MDWKRHLFIGSILAIVFAVIMHWRFKWYDFTNLAVVSQFIFIVALSPLVMDMDTKQGKLHRFLIGTGLMVGLVGVIGWSLVKLGFFITDVWVIPLIIGTLIGSVAFFLPRYTKHRGFLHSIPFVLLYSLSLFILTAFSYQMASLGFVGAYSHLLLDKQFLKMR